MESFLDRMARLSRERAESARASVSLDALLGRAAAAPAPLPLERNGFDLIAELLEQLRKCSPQFFEQVVVELLVKMGYGGSRRDAGEAQRPSGNGAGIQLDDEQPVGRHPGGGEFS